MGCDITYHEWKCTDTIAEYWSVDRFNLKVSKSETLQFFEALEFSDKFYDFLISSKCSGLVLLLWKPNLYIVPVLMSLKRIKAPTYPISNVKVVQDQGIVDVCRFLITFEDFGHLENFANPVKFCHCNVYLYENSCDNIYKFDNISLLYKTSGTTGKPKIVGISEKCVESNVEAFCKYFDMSNIYSIMLCSPLTFDPCLILIYFALKRRKCLKIIENKILCDGNLLAQVIEESPNSFIQLTPSLFNIIADSSLITDSNKKESIVVLGGEFIEFKLFTKIIEAKWATVFSLYGTTEVSCWSMVAKLNTDQKKYVVHGLTPLGVCLNGACIQLDNSEEVISCSSICASEINLKRVSGGYHSVCNSSRQFESILIEINSELDNSVAKWHQTGDYGCIIENSYYFVGRKDRLLKRKGSKISLNLLENYIMNEFQNIVSCVSACLIMNSSLRVSCKCNLEIESMKQKIVQSIRDGLGSKYLPDHMYLTFNESKPILSSNFKLQLSPEDYFLDLVICTLNLKNDNDFEQNFSQLGGDSLLAMYICNQFFSKYDNEEIKTKLLVKLLSRESILKIKQFVTETCLCAHNCDIQELTVEIHKPEDAIGLNALTTFKWKRFLGKCIDASAVCHLDKVFIGSHSGIFLCLSVENNDIVWSKTSEFEDQRIESTSALFIKFNQVIVGTLSGIIYSIDISTGETLWSFVSDGQIKSEVLVIESFDLIIFGSHGRKLNCLKVYDGQPILRWKISLDFSPITAKCCYVQHTDLVIVGTLGGGVFCVNIFDGTIMWQNDEPIGPVFATPVIVEENNCVVILTALGEFVCYEYTDGTKQRHLSNFTCDGKGFFMCPFVVSEKTDMSFIYAPCQDGKVYVFSSATKALMYAIDFTHYVTENQKLILTPVKVPASDLLIITCAAGKVLIFDRVKMKILWALSVDGEVFSTPKIFKRFSEENSFYMIFGCRDDYVYCFDMKCK